MVAAIHGYSGFALGIGGGEWAPSGVYGNDGAWSEASLFPAMTIVLAAK
jgi:hypothetical protein